MINNNLSLQTIAKQCEETTGSKQCDWLEALIIKASIEFRYSMEEIGNDNDKLNITDLCKSIKIGQSTFKQQLSKCDDQTTEQIAKYI
jgi:hypothetical protein